MAATTKSRQQLVVIGGWLGCQRKFLRRYEELYNSLGFETLTVVPTPRSTVEATLQLYRGKNQHRIQPPSPKGWPYSSFTSSSSSSSLDGDYGTMGEMAWDVLGKVYGMDPTMFLYHSFSNGGCFLWESICRIMEFQMDDTGDVEMGRQLKSLSSKCYGVVFDSCPAWFGSPPSKLWHALKHCSEIERQDIVSMYGPKVLTFSQRNTDRNQEYFDYLTEWSVVDIPQLYVYSKNDDLSDYDYIEMLIQNRRSIQRSPVLTQCWEVSEHCAHLREHPQDYKLAIEDFIRIATVRSKL